MEKPKPNDSIFKYVAFELIDRTKLENFEEYVCEVHSPPDEGIDWDYGIHILKYHKDEDKFIDNRDNEWFDFEIISIQMPYNGTFEIIK